MTVSEKITHEHEPDPHHDVYSRTVFGFWVYIVTDFMLFATLFATYDVLHNNVFGGPSARELFHLPYALIQTLIFIISSFIIGIGGAAAHRKHRSGTIIFYAIAFFLGVIFLWMELGTFAHLMAQGHDWKQSAFLSMYFTLVGTHALHIVFALVWFIVLIIPVCIHGLACTSQSAATGERSVQRSGEKCELTAANLRRLTCLRMFWQFLGIVWIFIFTVVYLLGVK